MQCLIENPSPLEDELWEQGCAVLLDSELVNERHQML